MVLTTLISRRAGLSIRADIRKSVSNNSYGRVKLLARSLGKGTY
jgi:hypothetical protein